MASLLWTQIPSKARAPIEALMMAIGRSLAICTAPRAALMRMGSFSSVSFRRYSGNYSSQYSFDCLSGHGELRTGVFPIASS